MTPSLPDETSLRAPDGRRYDIDAVRLWALFLLILYHAYASFTPFATEVAMVRPYTQGPAKFFDGITGSLAIALNVWRIPILFLIAGMAAAFSLENRTLREFVRERFSRIGIPLVFGSLTVFPLAAWLFLQHEGKPPAYYLHPGHLWFLVPILAYAVLLALGLWFREKFPKSAPGDRSQDRSPWRLVLFLMLGLVLTVVIARPLNYAAWVRSPHTLVFGFLCFITGFFIAKRGTAFRDWNGKKAWLFLILALVLFVPRWAYEVFRFERGFDLYPRGLYLIMTPVETCAWIFAALGFMGRFVRRPGKWLAYGTAAIFPVYILHYPVQNAVAILIGDFWPSKAGLFVLMVVLEIGLCLLLYEAIRRISVLRPIFGLRLRKLPAAGSSQLSRLSP